jgi:hypothetical protein
VILIFEHIKPLNTQTLLRLLLHIIANQNV